MNDEIKEILDKLEIVARKHTIEICEDGSKIETMPANIVDELRLNNYSSKLLLDYITNLQVENKHLDEVNCQLRKKINNDIYKSRCKKAIEYVNTHKPSDTISFPLMKKMKKIKSKVVLIMNLEKYIKKNY